MDDQSFRDATEYLVKARRICVFTGAGISAESGIPTFRDDAGLWREYPPERFAHWRGLVSEAWRNPSLVARFILAVLEPIAHARPNAAHQAIAQLEQNKIVTVVTQNIDHLHQEAGSVRVREVHGSLFKIIDKQRKIIRKLTRAELVQMVTELQAMLQHQVSIVKLLRSFRDILGLSWRGVHRPSIVLFNDAMAEPDWSQAHEDAETCDLMIVIGTSAQVFPACTLPIQAKLRRVPVIEINPGPAEFSGLWLQGKAAEVLPRLVQAAA